MDKLLTAAALVLVAFSIDAVKASDNCEDRNPGYCRIADCDDPSDRERCHKTCCVCGESGNSDVCCYDKSVFCGFFPECDTSEGRRMCRKTCDACDEEMPTTDTPRSTTTKSEETTTTRLQTSVHETPTSPATTPTSATRITTASVVEPTTKMAHAEECSNKDIAVCRERYPNPTTDCIQPFKDTRHAKDQCEAWCNLCDQSPGDKKWLKDQLLDCRRGLTSASAGRVSGIRMVLQGVCEGSDGELLPGPNSHRCEKVLSIIMNSSGRDPVLNPCCRDDLQRAIDNVITGTNRTEFFERCR